METELLSKKINTYTFEDALQSTLNYFEGDVWRQKFG